VARSIDPRKMKWIFCTVLLASGRQVWPAGGRPVHGCRQRRNRA